MTHEQLSGFRSRLNGMVRRLAGERAHLHDEARAGRGEAVVDPVELSTARNEEEVTLALLDNEEQLLAECQAAVERIMCGTFGKCEVCGNMISRERLDAIPYARTCVACVKRAE